MQPCATCDPVRFLFGCNLPVLLAQVLQGMPLVAALPRAVETAPTPWPASPEEEAVLVVPAQQELLPLQPSKLAVYKLFMEQVVLPQRHECHLSLEAVARVCCCTLHIGHEAEKLRCEGIVHQQLYGCAFDLVL